jgi:hypothetical protein
MYGRISRRRRPARFSVSSFEKKTQRIPPELKALKNWAESAS